MVFLRFVDLLGLGVVSALFRDSCFASARGLSFALRRVTPAAPATVGSETCAARRGVRRSAGRSPTHLPGDAMTTNSIIDTATAAVAKDTKRERIIKVSSEKTRLGTPRRN